MNKTQIKKMMENVKKSGWGVYDTKTYRYTIGADGELYRTRIEWLDTARMHERKAWEKVEH